MLRQSLWTALLLTAPIAAAVAAPAAQDLREELLREARAEFVAPALVAAKAGPSAGVVGDADSFGRNVKWIGSMQGGLVALQPDCSTFTGGADDRCITLNAAPALTTFSVTDIARITLPARAANSLICQWVTPFLFYNFNNTTALGANAQFRANPSITVENPVLNDPALINPDTGLPFGGSFTFGLTGGYFASHTLAPGEREAQRLNFSRVCIGGILNKQNLVGSYGLSAAEADAFFRTPMTIRLNLSGSVALVEGASLMYGIRFTGD